MKIYIFLLLCILSFTTMYAIPFHDVSDDFVIANVGKAEITKSDLANYMAGYKSIKIWNSDSLTMVLNAIITDMLFMNACIDEKITMTNAELYWYTEFYFEKLGLDINNGEAVQIYFDSSDPYLDMDDFLIKSRFFLLKSKYIMYKEKVPSIKASHIFFSTENKNKKQTAEIEKTAIQIANTLQDSQIPFTALFNQFDDQQLSSNSGDIGIITLDGKNKFVPKNEVRKVFKAGLFSPVYVKNSMGFSIIFNTSYSIPSTEVLFEVMEDLKKRYQVTINLFF